MSVAHCARILNSNLFAHYSVLHGRKKHIYVPYDGEKMKKCVARLVSLSEGVVVVVVVVVGGGVNSGQQGHAFPASISALHRPIPVSRCLAVDDSLFPDTINGAGSWNYPSAPTKRPPLLLLLCQIKATPPPTPSPSCERGVGNGAKMSQLQSLPAIDPPRWSSSFSPDEAVVVAICTSRSGVTLGNYRRWVV